MSQRFIWESGQSGRKMHLSGFDRLGRANGALCGIRHAFDRSCNLPLGKGTCKRCIKIERELAHAD